MLSTVLMRRWIWMDRMSHLIAGVAAALFTIVVLGPGAPSALAQYSLAQALRYLKLGH